MSSLSAEQAGSLESKTSEENCAFNCWRSDGQYRLGIIQLLLLTDGFSFFVFVSWKHSWASSKIASLCRWICLDKLSCWRICAWNLSAFHWRAEMSLVYLPRALVFLFQYYHTFFICFFWETSFPVKFVWWLWARLLPSSCTHPSAFYLSKFLFVCSW